MSQERIYFDNAATTPIHPEVIDKMVSLMKDTYGNPSSIHLSGRTARTVIEEARKTIANSLKCSIGEIFFTGSATESNNMVLRRAVRDLGVKRMIISKVEHPCVMNTAKELHENGSIGLDFLDVNQAGFIDLKDLEEKLNKTAADKTLVSIMHVNNEIGSVQNIEAIGNLCKTHNALFHCDAVQAIGKFNLDLSTLNIDFLSATGHKFHGPKGVGFMFISGDQKIQPFITGGGQERNMRSGTENVHGIAGLALALKLYSENTEEKLKFISEIKQNFKSKLKSAIPEVNFIEDQYPNDFIPTILSVSFPENAKTELMTFNLDIAGISASAGSACASGVEQASHVLEAIKFPEDRRAVRFSFSYFNTKEEVDMCVERIKKIL